jgi:hypothetical protein
LRFFIDFAGFCRCYSAKLSQIGKKHKNAERKKYENLKNFQGSTA